MVEDTIPQQNTDKEAWPKTLTGLVVSDAMNNSVVVRVTRYVKHPKYKKYVRKMKRYAAHDPGNAHKVGDNVTIVECRPISKTKHFTVVRSS